MLSFVVHSDSLLLNKGIKESAIREQTHGLVIGIEREGERLLNPESGTVFKLNDVVWIVGNEKRIQVIASGRKADKK
ncbi:MAG: TrkA C-terminal domain-containing protein [Sediminibacterium sp.]|nr:TrkA C-terminal domain-containing protein [Sediminibacterium sp.]